MIKIVQFITWKNKLKKTNTSLPLNKNIAVLFLFFLNTSESDSFIKHRLSYANRKQVWEK